MLEQLARLSNLAVELVGCRFEEVGMSEVDGADAELVDVWNSNTFGREIRAYLRENQLLIEQYHREDDRLDGLDNDEHLAEHLQGNRHFGAWAMRHDTSMYNEKTGISNPSR